MFFDKWWGILFSRNDGELCSWGLMEDYILWMMGYYVNYAIMNNEAWNFLRIFEVRFNVDITQLRLISWYDRAGPVGIRWGRRTVRYQAVSSYVHLNLSRDLELLTDHILPIEIGPFQKTVRIEDFANSAAALDIVWTKRIPVGNS